jgi:hypothetical protein
MIGAAVTVSKIATGEIDDLTNEDGKHAAAVVSVVQGQLVIIVIPWQRTVDHPLEILPVSCRLH